MITQSLVALFLLDYQPSNAQAASSPASVSPQDETSLPEDDFFDVDAPLDNSADIGVDWPDPIRQNEEAEPLPATEQGSEKPSATQAPIKLSGNNDKPTENGNPTGVEKIASEDLMRDGADEDARVRRNFERQQALQFADDDSAELEVLVQDDRPLIDIVQIDDEQNYRILFSGLENVDTNRIFERFNAISSLQNQPSQGANRSQILRRAKNDLELLDQLLRLEGYYDNLSEYQIVSSAPNEGAIDVDVIFSVVPGKRYRFGEINLVGIENSADEQFLRNALSFQSGDPVQQDAIVDSKALLFSRLVENGYVFGKVGQEELLIDHARQEGDLTLPVTPNGKYDFGRIVTAPDAILSGKHLETIARFDTGDLYQLSQVDDLRQALFATSLVSAVEITPVKGANNQVDLNVEIEPAPPRTVAGLAGFNTGEGFRVEASWEHRNFFPPEGAINIAGVLGTREQAVGVTYRRNNFQGRDRVLTSRFALRNQNLDAFNARSLDLAIGYERQTTLIFQKKWAWNIGLEYSLSDEEAIFEGVESRELFNILALPAGLAYDNSDDLLDPTKGFRLSARIAPETSTGVDAIAYFKSQIDGSIYQKIREDLVFAGRVRFASITGAPTSSIAPSRRNYAGGGGSVRGFGFQDIGPVDINGDPSGGRGLAEFAIEARYRIGSFGIVPFLDAGGVSAGALPDFNDLRFGAGIGLRYYTSFGPVRIDVGTPLSRRDGENVIAVAISLGQAF